MKPIFTLIGRNIKLFFKDKGTLFTSLITPIILLLLYVVFLANVYKDSFLSAIPEGFEIPDKVINGMVGGQLFSSLLAVICVTVAFSANMIMVQDKVNGAAMDFSVTPIGKWKTAFAYYIATLLNTVIICLIAICAGLIYLACVGWYMSAGDVFLLILDVFLMSMFGTALSSLLNVFVRTQGQMAAVGTIVSAGYGFICGAYMPLSNMGSGLLKFVSLLPGTYGTSLFRNHALRGVLDEMKSLGTPDAVIEGIRNSVDCNIDFFGHDVSETAMYLVVVFSVIIFLGLYVLLASLAPKMFKTHKPIIKKTKA